MVEARSVNVKKTTQHDIYKSAKKTGLPNPSRETKFSGAKGDRETFIFPDQLTTSRIGNLTRSIPTLAMCYDHTYL